MEENIKFELEKSLVIIKKNHQSKHKYDLPKNNPTR